MEMMVSDMKRLLISVFAVAFLLTLLPSTPAKAALADGLIAFYDFEDPDYPGKDVSGNGNHLFYCEQGEEKYTFSSKKMKRDAGVTGKAAYFNGANGLMALLDSTGLDFMDKLAKSLTVCLNVKLDVEKIPSGPHIRIMDNGLITIDNKPYGGFSISTYFGGNTACNFNIWPAFRDGRGLLYAPANNIQHVIDYDYDDWHTIWVVMDGDSTPATVRLYIDTNWTQEELQLTKGFIFKEKAFPFNMGGTVRIDPETGDFWLINDSSTGSFVGWLDNVYIFNRALSEEELNQVTDIKAKSVPDPKAPTTPGNTDESKPASKSSDKSAPASKANGESSALSGGEDSSGSESESEGLASEKGESESVASQAETGTEDGGQGGGIWVVVIIIAICVIAAGLILLLLMKKPSAKKDAE